MQMKAATTCAALVALLACTAQAASPQRGSLVSSLATAAAAHASAAVSGTARGLQLAKPLSEALLVTAAAGDWAQTARLADQMAEQLGTGECSTTQWLRGRLVLANTMLDERGLQTLEGIGAHQDLLRASLQLPMDACAGWASAYWVAARPSEAAQCRTRLFNAAAHSRAAYTHEPSQLLSTLLWTHACNAYAFARADDDEGYALTVDAFASDVGAADVAAALVRMPADDYPLWLASFLQAAASLMGDRSLIAALNAAPTLAQPRLPSDGPDHMLALSMGLYYWPTQ
jgi:CubicO group peptidase (beta-lactamase class C family)